MNVSNAFLANSFRAQQNFHQVFNALALKYWSNTLDKCFHFVYNIYVSVCFLQCIDKNRLQQITYSR